MTHPISPDWIAVDWGTTNLRAFAMQGASVLARVQSGDGMGTLTPDGFEPALRRLIDPWLQAGNIPVIACGMVGSRQGWIEAAYRSVPCTPVADHMVSAPTRDDLSVRIVSGLSQSIPPDVMRGEETQIAGFLQLNPGWDGVLCMPGTHTKWVHLSAGEVVSFQTFMTGELFSLIGTKSVLRHTVADAGWDNDAFALALSETLSHPEKLAARLFGLRAGQLLQGTDGASARAQLSGMLVGAELAAARPYWLGQNLAIMGTGAQANAYRDGLAPQGVSCLMVDTERATLAGLTAAYRMTKETI